MQDKRADYFACGTLVVWDVDLQSEDVIKPYKASAPENPVIFRRGEIADAEPAVPGWRMAMDECLGRQGTPDAFIHFYAEIQRGVSAYRDRRQ
jgi:hypothetical protein